MSQGLSFSVIVPAYNSERTIEVALNSIFKSEYKAFEVIVVDDASSDRTARIASEFDCKLISLDETKGAATARNTGAAQANAEILVFIDSDVIVEGDFLARFKETFDKTNADSVVGMYSREIIFSNPLSVYKNLFLHFNQDNDSMRFWSGCAAIKKDVFFKLEGFNEKKKGSLASEDTELGYALSASGYKIEIDRKICVRHNHKYTFKKLLKNDFLKTAEWLKILFQSRKRKSCKKGYYLNLRNLLSLLCVFFGLVSMILLPTAGEVRFMHLTLVSCLLVFLAVNIRFYALLARKGGVIFLLLGPLFHIASSIAAIFGIGYAILNLSKT